VRQGAVEKKGGDLKGEIDKRPKSLFCFRREYLILLSLDMAGFFGHG
jgi:hypothetical protein